MRKLFFFVSIIATIVFGITAFHYAKITADNVLPNSFLGTLLIASSLLDFVVVIVLYFINTRYSVVLYGLAILMFFCGFWGSVPVWWGLQVGPDPVTNGTAVLFTVLFFFFRFIAEGGVISKGWNNA